MASAREILADIKEQAEAMTKEASTSGGGLLDRISDSQFEELANRIASQSEKQAAVDHIRDMRDGAVSSPEAAVRKYTNIKKLAYRQAMKNLGLSGKVTPLDIIGEGGNPAVKLASVGAEAAAELIAAAISVALNPFQVKR